MQRCPKPVYNEGQAMERVDSKLNWKENINSVLEKKRKKSELKNVLHEKSEMIWSQFRCASDFVFIFYNAVICSIIMFGSVCWGWNI